MIVEVRVCVGKEAVDVSDGVGVGVSVPVGVGVMMDVGEGI